MMILGCSTQEKEEEEEDFEVPPCFLSPLGPGPSQVRPSSRCELEGWVWKTGPKGQSLQFPIDMSSNRSL